MSDLPTRIRRVELRCSNVEASAGFYSRVTGLEPAALDRDEARLGPPEDPSRTLLLLRRAAEPGHAPHRAAGLFHTAFRYPTRGALGAILHRLDELPGAGLTGVSDHGVSEALYLDDPDGLGIELYRDRPLAEWPPPEPGERVRMFTAPLDLPSLAGAGSPDRGLSPATGIDIGHVHLKVADTALAERFWTERLGMDLMTRYGEQASFLAHDGYHHHVGVNSWQSLGAGLEPESGPGLDAVVLVGEPMAGPLRTPDGVAVEVEA